MFDRHYDELAVGDTATYRGVTISEAHIVGFAGIVGDHYPLHVDEEYAKTTKFGARIAHGFLVLASCSGMFPMRPGVVIAFYGMDDVRFLAPTFIGDTLHCEQEIVAKRDKGDGGVVSVRTTMVNQRDAPVCVATLHILTARRPA
jgi:acyl dehydratase